MDSHIKYRLRIQPPRWRHEVVEASGTIAAVFDLWLNEYSNMANVRLIDLMQGTRDRVFLRGDWAFWLTKVNDYDDGVRLMARSTPFPREGVAG